MHAVVVHLHAIKRHPVFRVPPYHALEDARVIIIPKSNPVLNHNQSSSDQLERRMTVY